MIILFYTGCCLASFAFCFAGDWVNQQINVFRRSACDFCRQPLVFIDLMPLISQVLHGFCCRYCKAKTSPFYIYSEISGGFLLLWTYFIFSDLPILFAVSFCLVTLLMIFCDFHRLFVPDILQVMMFILCLYFTSYQNMDLTYQLIHMFFIFFILCLLALLQPDSIGGADIKLISILAFCLPIHLTAWLIFWAAFLGLLYLLLVKFVFNYSFSLIPFVPFIFISFYIIMSFYV